MLRRKLLGPVCKAGDSRVMFSWPGEEGAAQQKRLCEPLEETEERLRLTEEALKLLE